jgi:integrase
MSWERFEAGIRSSATLRLYQNRMGAFLKFAELTPDQFAKLPARKAEDAVMRYISHLKARVSRGEISPDTVHMSVAPIQLFSVMNRMKLEWKFVMKQAPTKRKYSSDRAPTIEEIRQMLQHAPLRIRAAVLIMASGGLRVGAFQGMKVGDVIDLEGDAAKVLVYRGESEEYFTFITPEANKAFREYLNFRKAHGETITPESPVLRDAFDTRSGGHAKDVETLQSDSLERDIGRLWWKSGARTQAKRRHEFKTVHGFRKFFKSRAEQAMKPINVELLMGHDIGVSNSYYRPRESEIFEDYKKAIPQLSIDESYRLKDEFAERERQLRAEFQSELNQRLAYVESEVRALRMQKSVPVSPEAPPRSA